jgi:hypothetical protein
MDILSTTEPKSDQQNFDDYSVAPRTVTVSEVKRGNPEQPVEVHLVEFPGRPFKPSKSMRRVLIACWGPEASAYKGRHMTLYGDPTVRFGGKPVGGIRIAALSHIDEAKSIPLTITRGKREPFIVQPLPTEIAEHLAALTGATSLEELQAAWQLAAKAGVTGFRQLVDLKDARKVELTPDEDVTEPVDSSVVVP